MEKKRLKAARSSKTWEKIVISQRAIIVERINRYNNVSTIKEQLREIGDLTHYTRYKTTTVTRYLREALEKIDRGKYGICQDCDNYIKKQRLVLVPAAIRCAKCQKEKDKRRDP